MRQIVLDTETTGLDLSLGHRIIEIGAVEVVNRQLTGRTFHRYLNPDRESDPGAIAVHGISNEFLTDKPRFPDIVDEFLAFIADAELVIHNAPFDVGFLNAELDRLDLATLAGQCIAILDTLKLAKEMHPGQKNNLDALCRRYQVDNSGRAYHGALLDARLLAEVYLAMTRGQDSLAIDALRVEKTRGSRPVAPVRLRVLNATAEELAAHAAYLRELEKESGVNGAW